jgi:hypothetical protein
MLVLNHTNVLLQKDSKGLAYKATYRFTDRLTMVVPSVLLSS